MSTGPLLGRRVVVTRRPEQSGELARGLAELGAEVLELPTLALAPPEDCGPLDDALRRLSAFDWLVFTSANAVTSVRERLAALALAPPARPPRGASVGAATTVACREALSWLPIELQPETDFRAEGLLAAFERVEVAGRSVLAPLSERARDVLVSGLAARGALVTAPVAYRNVTPPGLAERYAELARVGFDLLVFASPSAVQNLAAAVGEAALRGRAAAVIGPVTEQAAHAAGLHVVARAEPSTSEGLVAALARGSLSWNPRMAPPIRRDVYVPNESDGFVFAAAALRGSGLMPGEREWLRRVAACELLPVLVESEDPAHVRVVVGGELEPDEQQGWVGRVAGGLRLADGRLALCGGAAWLIDADDWTEAFARVLDVPPGDYQATLYCYASAPNGRLCLEAAGSDERLGAWFRRTRAGQEMPGWLHNRCVDDPDEDPGHKAQWKKARRRPGSRVIDFLLHLEPAAELTAVEVGDHGFAEAGDCRQPEPFPLGLVPVALEGLDEEEEEEVAAPATPQVESQAAPYALQPIAGGPVEVPVAQLTRLARLAWLCHAYTRPALRLACPGGAPALQDVDGATLTRSGGVVAVSFDDDGQPHGAEAALVAVAKQLGALPEGTQILLETSRTRQPQGARPVGLHRYRGQVEGGAWRVAEAFPPTDAARLGSALALVETLVPARRLAARNEAEAERIVARLKAHAPHVLDLGLQRAGAELSFPKRSPEAFLEVVRRAFWLRHAADWPLQDCDLEPPR